MALTPLEIKTAKEYQLQFQKVLQGISQGRLSDFSDSSVLTILSEVFGLGFGGLDARLNDEITQVVFGSIAQLFGVTNALGTKAQLRLVFYPQNIDQVAPFTIEASFPVLVNGVLFRTDSQVSIPPGSLFGEVLATAAEVGERGNISIGSSVSWQPVSGLANIAVSQSSPVVQRGTDPLDYSGAVNQLTGSLVNQALITTSDYEALLATRFPNQIFSAIPNLDKDKVTKKSGIIHLFGCNEDFSNLTELQKLEVANSFQGGWALVYVSDFNEVTLRVSVIATLIPGGTPGTVGTAINQALLEHFSLRNQRGKTSIKLNDAIAQVYKIDGVQSVSYLSFDLGDGVFKSENIALQNIYTLIVLGLVTVQFEGLPAVNSYVNI